MEMFFFFYLIKKYIEKIFEQIPNYLKSYFKAKNKIIGDLKFGKKITNLKKKKGIIFKKKPEKNKIDLFFKLNFWPIFFPDKIKLIRKTEFNFKKIKNYRFVIFFKKKSKIIKIKILNDKSMISFIYFYINFKDLNPLFGFRVEKKNIDFGSKNNLRFVYFQRVLNFFIKFNN